MVEGREGRRSGERGGTGAGFSSLGTEKGYVNVTRIGPQVVRQQSILLHKQAKIGTKTVKNCREKRKFTVADGLCQ